MKTNFKQKKKKKHEKVLKKSKHQQMKYKTEVKTLVVFPYRMLWGGNPKDV